MRNETLGHFAFRVYSLVPSHVSSANVHLCGDDLWAGYCRRLGSGGLVTPAESTHVRAPPHRRRVGSLAPPRAPQRRSLATQTRRDVAQSSAESSARLFEKSTRYFSLALHFHQHAMSAVATSLAQRASVLAAGRRPVGTHRSRTGHRARPRGLRSGVIRAVVADPGAAAAGKDSESENDGSRSVVQLFRRPFLSDEAAATLCRKANAKDAVNGAIASVVTEQCFNVEVTSPLTSDEMATLQWLPRETFEPDLFTEATQLDGDVVEVGRGSRFSPRGPPTRCPSARTPDSAR